jgi:DNA-binding transcriptional regulator GbsR (MarR family)
MTPDTAAPDPQATRDRALSLVAETMGELVEFWGFKASLGRIWATLYLSSEPLSADRIAEVTGLSSGAVSMGIQELAQWGLIDRVLTMGDRKRHYTATTDIWEVIRRVFRERELRLVGRAVERFSEALRLLEEARRAAPDDDDLPFVIDRVRGLLLLARTGYQLVERFADIGTFSLQPIRGTLDLMFGRREG